MDPELQPDAAVSAWRSVILTQGSRASAPALRPQDHVEQQRLADAVAEALAHASARRRRRNG